MHCATLEISQKDDYTPVSFMLSFGRLAVFLSYMPSISRRIVLLLIFSSILPSLLFWHVLEASVALFLLIEAISYINRGGMEV